MEYQVEVGSMKVAQLPDDECFLINARGDEYSDPSVVHFESERQVRDAIEALQRFLGEST